MLYVSRAPWSIYEVLDEFFRLHRIPVGPILFLREWGLTLAEPAAAPRARPQAPPDPQHAGALPRAAVRADRRQRPARSRDLRPDRARASRAACARSTSATSAATPAGTARSRRWRGEVVGAGSTLLLAADSLAMAEHAAEHGLISGAARARCCASSPTTRAPRPAGATERGRTRRARGPARDRPRRRRAAERRGRGRQAGGAAALSARRVRRRGCAPSPRSRRRGWRRSRRCA